MIELYKSGKNWTMVVELSNLMVKKFRLKKEAWKFFIGSELERAKEEEVKDGYMKRVLERALKALPKC